MILLYIVGGVAAVLGTGLVAVVLLRGDEELWTMSEAWLRERGWGRW